MSVVQYSFAAGAARLVLDRPDAGNAIDLDLVRDLHAGVRRAAQDDARVVVLSANGSAFCVGGDVRRIARSSDPGRLVDDLAEALHRAISDLQQLDAVVVSAVHAVAAGAGVALAAAADVVLAGEAARFTLAYTKVGLTPDGGSSLLSGSVGLHRALHLALLNPLLSARDAREMGLVAEVHPDSELQNATDAVVEALLSGSRDAQVATKRLLRRTVYPDPAGLLRHEAVSIRAAAGGADGTEGTRAFLEKRTPAFPSSALGGNPRRLKRGLMT